MSSIQFNLGITVRKKIKMKMITSTIHNNISSKLKDIVLYMYCVMIVQRLNLPLIWIWNLEERKRVKYTKYRLCRVRVAGRLVRPNRDYRWGIDNVSEWLISKEREGWRKRKEEEGKREERDEWMEEEMREEGERKIVEWIVERREKGGYQGGAVSNNKNKTRDP